MLLEAKLLLFTSPTCTQCKGIKGELKQLKWKYEELDEDSEINGENAFSKYNITTLPTLMLVGKKDGEEVLRFTGYHTKEQILDWFEE